MRPVEFQVALSGERFLQIPLEVAAKLPDHGTATVVVVVNGDTEDRSWQQAAYEQFLADDTDADASYDRYL
jgi:hypothetical protein